MREFCLFSFDFKLKIIILDRLVCFSKKMAKDLASKKQEQEEEEKEEKQEVENL